MIASGSANMQKFVGLVVLLVTVAGEHRFNHEEKEYVIEPTVQLNFYGAIEFCADHNMRLLAIESAEENNLLQKEVQKCVGESQIDFWTSGNRLSNSDNWFWMSTGKPITNFYWGDGQPDNVDGLEDCLEIRVGFYPQGWWNDKNCKLATSSVICENLPHKNTTEPAVDQEK